MNEPAEKIIVFEVYDTAVMANLAKTKLDAYGIPCFLTGETFAATFALNSQIFPGTRLHIFERDLERVKEIVADILPPAPMHCPKCESSNTVVVEIRESSSVSILKSFFLLLSHVLPIPMLINPRKIYRCQNCNLEFSPDALKSRVLPTRPI